MTNPDEIGSGSQDHLTPETIGPEYIFPQDRPGTIISDKYERAGGMQLRDYMAAQALPGIQAQGTSITNAAMNAAMNAATVAYAIADAMLLVRARPTILVNPESIQPKGDA